MTPSAVANGHTVLVQPAHFNKGLLMVHEMELSLAEHCFNEALAIDPSDPLIQLNLAQLHLKINQNVSSTCRPLTAVVQRSGRDSATRAHGTARSSHRCFS